MAAGVVLIALMLACGPGVPPAIARFECNRCHTSTSFAAATHDRSCVGCHNAIHDGGYDGFRYDQAVVGRWKSNVKHFVHLPTLTGAGDRFERSWFVEFLQHPHDLRPNLDETMPAIPIDAAAAAELADALGLKDRPRTAAAGDAQVGRGLLGSLGCTTCHRYTGATLGSSGVPPVPVTSTAIALAPDLRYTRERMVGERIEAWLENPQAIKADSAMPRFDLTPSQRQDLTAALLTTPLAPLPKRALPTPLPLLTRPVRHAEVEARVFKKVCWHCHSDGAAGDSGPGNAGGLGFRGVGLDLGSQEGIQAGKWVGGQFTSVLSANGEPPLVRHLLARHAEVAGQPTPDRGMPLGLPPLSLEDIQLVASWIDQGALP